MSRVQSIARAFAVLGALEDGPRGVTEVSERVGLPKSTAARMLTTLVREGAVEQLDDTRYRLGARVAALGRAVEPTRDLIAVARPHLVELSTAVGETAGLSVPDGDVVHYIDQVDADHEVQIRDWTGSRVPMHAVSSGQVYLARMSAADLEAFVSRPLAWFTPQTLDHPDRLRDRVAQVRRDGYAWVREEFAEGLTSVAVAVVDKAGNPVAAVHLHGPSYRFPPHGSTASIERQLTTAAARIGSALG